MVNVFFIFLAEPSAGCEQISKTTIFLVIVLLVAMINTKTTIKENNKSFAVKEILTSTNLSSCLLYNLQSS